MLRSVLLAAALAALTACGQPASTSNQSAPVATTSALTPQEIATALAALPAPYNSADYESGRRTFAQCRACHTLDAGSGDRVGPNLHGVIGRRIASRPGFTYSDALKRGDFNWDGAHLDQWLTSPQAMFPGTRMAFAGIRDATQRRNLIAYLMVESAR